MLYLILYFLIPILVICGFLMLNTKHKWFTQYDAERLEAEEVALGIFAFVIWPITLTLLGIGLGLKFLKENVLPED